jgi:hypothetical protein
MQILNDNFQHLIKVENYIIITLIGEIIVHPDPTQEECA